MRAHLLALVLAVARLTIEPTSLWRRSPITLPLWLPVIIDARLQHSQGTSYAYGKEAAYTYARRHACIHDMHAIKAR